jgi:hypothetical protein
MNHPSLTRRIAERLNQQENNRQRFNQLPFAIYSTREYEENNPIVIFHLIGLGSGIGRVVSQRTI